MHPQGHEGRYSIYVHASQEKPVHASPLFVGRGIRSTKVVENLIFCTNFQKLFVSPIHAWMKLQDRHKNIGYPVYLYPR